jgi:ferrochelatase
MLKTVGVLLINLGTPLSPTPKDVYRYLIEFLTDRRVIDLPWWRRQLLVRGIIVPKRYRASAKAYQEIWTDEGSPLLVYGNKVKNSLQEVLGDRYIVEIAMRYQQPSIKNTLEGLLKKGVNKLIILPLFPQYASATTGSIHDLVLKTLSNRVVIPQLYLIKDFPTHPLMIDAFCRNIQNKGIINYDHLLFSFHGLPERQILKSDSSGCCLMSSCCNQITTKNSSCYRAQCYATMNAIVQKLDLSVEKFSICFQSRLGKEPWLQPYASDAILSLAQKGKKRILVVSPSFVCDCIETTYEIGVEYAKEFQHAGGETLDLVEGLNDHPLWIQALKNLTLEGYQ